jgi:hypothetical protein
MLGTTIAVVRERAKDISGAVGARVDKVRQRNGGTSGRLELGLSLSRPTPACRRSSSLQSPTPLPHTGELGAGGILGRLCRGPGATPSHGGSSSGRRL